MKPGDLVFIRKYTDEEQRSQKARYVDNPGVSMCHSHSLSGEAMIIASSCCHGVGIELVVPPYLQDRHHIKGLYVGLSESDLIPVETDYLMLSEWAKSNLTDELRGKLNRNLSTTTVLVYYPGLEPLLVDVLMLRHERLLKMEREFIDDLANRLKEDEDE